MLSDTDRIFADVYMYNHLASEGMVHLLCPGRTREVNLNTTNGICYVNAQRTMLPFGLFKTQKAAWEVLKELGTSGLRRIQDWDKLVDFHAQRTEKTRDTIATSYFSETPSQHQIRGAQVRKVMRMFIEEDRAVFIWEMLAEPTLKGTNLPAGYHLQSTMQVIMRHGEVSSIDGENSTEISIHFSASRRDLDLPTSANFREPGHLYIGISVWEKLISCIVPEVENVLIDETGSIWNVDE